MSLTAMTQSPPPATTCSTISFWQPMASIVMSVPASSICSRSCGMAVISLDLASVATWPSAIPSSLAQALTMCRAPRPFARSCDRRQVLPSMATRRAGSSASVRIASTIQAWKQRWKASGFSAMSRRRMQSREGMPLGRARCWASQDCPMLGPAMDGGGAVAPADDAADGDDDDIDQEVLAIARVPGVGERFEVGADGADVDELGHGRHPGIGRCGPWRPNGGRQRPEHEDRNQDIEPRPVAPDYPDRSAIRAGRVADEPRRAYAPGRRSCPSR